MLIDCHTYSVLTLLSNPSVLILLCKQSWLRVWVLALPFNPFAHSNARVAPPKTRALCSASMCDEKSLFYSN